MPVQGDHDNTKLMHFSDEKSVCSQPGYVSYVLPNVFTIQLYFLF